MNKFTPASLIHFIKKVNFAAFRKMNLSWTGSNKTQPAPAFSKVPTGIKRLPVQPPKHPWGS